MSDGRTGGGFFGALADSTEHAGFMLVLLLQSVVRGFTPRHPVRAFGRLVEQMHVQMVKSLGVVSVVAVFTGMILSLQTGETLHRYGAADQLPGIVGASMAREMGPFVTAIILAATVGSAIAAELGTMRVSEEIDALELMNIDPVGFLVSPRVIALGVTAVLLTLLVDVIGVVGGAVVAQAQFGTPMSTFFDGARAVLGSSSFVSSSSAPRRWTASSERRRCAIAPSSMERSATIGRSFTKARARLTATRTQR